MVLWVCDADRHGHCLLVAQLDNLASVCQRRGGAKLVADDRGSGRSLASCGTQHGLHHLRCKPRAVKKRHCLAASASACRHPKAFVPHLVGALMLGVAGLAKRLLRQLGGTPRRCSPNATAPGPGGQRGRTTACAARPSSCSPNAANSATTCAISAASGHTRASLACSSWRVCSRAARSAARVPAPAPR